MDLMGGRVGMVRERRLKNGRCLRGENGKKVRSATALMGICAHMEKHQKHSHSPLV